MIGRGWLRVHPKTRVAQASACACTHADRSRLCDSRVLGCTLIAAAALAGLLAAPAAVPAALAGHRGDFDFVSWLIGFGCAWAASIGLLVSGRRRDGGPGWARVVAALTLAGWAPLAVTSAAMPVRADFALLTLTLAVVLADGSTLGFRWVGTALLTGLACGLDATALVWPIGLTWSAWSRRGHRVGAVVVLGAGLVATGCVWAGGQAILTGHTMVGAGYSLHRDMLLLLPVLVLGLAGYAGGRRASGGGQARWWMPGWSAVGLLAILAIVATAPLNPRLAVLGMWWLMPAGLADLARMVRRDAAQPPLLRAVGGLCLLVLILLAWEPVHRWVESVYAAIYVLGV